MESESFRFSNTEWIYTPSQAGGGNPSSPLRTGVQAVTATCKSCGHTWRARQYGNGKLQALVGGVLVTCPACEHDENVPGHVFEQIM